MSVLPQMRRYKLSEDGVAGIDIIGEGPKGAKSFNLIRKAEMLENCGFLFPRRNLVLKQSILLEGLRHAGLKEEWDNEPIPVNPEARAARRKFVQWAIETFWPLVEQIFEGRAFFVRSNASGDSLGRGVYSSVPFVNRHRIYTDEPRRPLGFAYHLLKVVESYFSDTAAAFRVRSKTEGAGINVMFCQFIGRPGQTPDDRHLLVPFMSAVVKSTLVEENPGDGLIRFEYGAGKGATSGRTLLYHEEETPDTFDTKLRFETISGRDRLPKLDVSTRNMHAVTFDIVSGNDEVFHPEHYATFESLLMSAYPFMKRQFIVEGYELLRWLASKAILLEFANERPIYLECVVSSFRDELRWFVVQVADFDPVHQLPKPPEKDVFISSDFYGHGMLEESRRRIFIFGKEFIKNPDWKARLAGINKANKGFVALIPQKALTGVDLTQLSGGHFSNAGLVIEYRTLGSYKFERSVHIEGLSSEHFEQVMQDFDVLFIAAQNILSDEDATKVNPVGISEGTALVSAACDRERGFAWWRINGLELGVG